MMRKTVTLLFLVLATLGPSSLWATTADSCSKADVDTAYAATAEGGTLTLPVCNDGVTWETGLTVDKAISIIGNGSTGAAKTKIIAHANLNSGVIAITASTTSLVRISGIYFDMVTTPATDRIAIKSAGTMTQLQIDNNYINGGKAQYYQIGKAHGVIFKNTFHNGESAMDLSGDNSVAWGRTIAAGTGMGLNTLYIEDNTFSRDGNLTCKSHQNYIEGSQGIEAVIRYNTFDSSAYCVGNTNAAYDEHIMIHGNGSALSGDMRGPPVIEIYNNKHISNAMYYIIFRGGSVLYHDNVIIDSTWNPSVLLREEGISYTTDGAIAWPMVDQIFNSFFWNNTVNGSAMAVTWPYPGESDSYCTGSGAPFACCTGNGAGNCDEVVVENRDYFLHAPAASGGSETLYDSGTSKYTFFDASNKMTFSAAGANAYFPYTIATCPHTLTGLTGACTTTAGTGGYNVATTYTITQSVGTGCTTSPSGTLIVDGTEQTLTVTGSYGVTCTASGLGGTFSNGVLTYTATGNGAITTTATEHTMKGVGTGSGSITGIGTGSGTITLGN